MLKWILEPLKSLVCSEDTENSHPTIYYRRKLLSTVQYNAKLLKAKPIERFQARTKPSLVLKQYII